MTSPTDPTRYPLPELERVERALTEMRARRARLRRLRTAGASGALIVLVAIVAVALSSSGGHRIRVAGPGSTTSTTANAGTTTTTTTTTLPTRKTDVVVYRPYTAAGVLDPSLRITSRSAGNCVTGESSRSYRCFAVSPGSNIYDPCFVIPDTGALACPINPATPDIVEFTPTAPPSGSAPLKNRPWAFQLSSGAVCVFVSAAWGGLGPYDCQRTDSSITPADCRPPATSQPWWTAECQDQRTGASPFTRQQVSKVWF